jgi:uncharacterized protein YdeI (YjbR/CyaY-like superfamily)
MRERKPLARPSPKRRSPDSAGIAEKALGRNKKAMSAFEAFSPSHKREYLEWITEAKSNETRDRRINQAIEWMTEGKPRNWKYMKR